MLKKLTPLQKEVMRRLVTGQRPQQIEAELDVTAKTILNWQKDPLFQSELRELEDSVKSKLRERLTAMEILEEAANKAAELCADVVANGKIGNEEVSTKMRLDAAFDLLNRVGANRTKKAHVDNNETLADLVIDAYYKGKNERGSRRR